MALPPNPYNAPCCANILMSSACQQINFYWAGQHIDGSGFSFVALALASQPPGGIAVNEVVLPAGVGAYYEIAANTINIAPTLDFSNPSDQMIIVHESTHALQDAEMPGQTIRGVDAEAAAYVAAALYNVYAAPDPNGPLPYTLPANSSQLWTLAQGIAQNVYGNPGYAIDPTTMAPLRQAILTDPTYLFLATNPTYAETGVTL